MLWAGELETYNKKLKMEKLIDVLNRLKDEVEVEWDRFTLSADNNFYFVYGWIKRKDGQRDFVIIEFWCDSPDALWYSTSSAKYTEKICEIISGQKGEHNPCRKISELLPACP